MDKIIESLIAPSNAPKPRAAVDKTQGMGDSRPLLHPVGSRAGCGFFSLWMYTMNRCLARRPLLALAWATLSCLIGPAQAQTAYVRNFPAQALRGTLVVVQPPVVTMNGQADRLSPGARIRGTNNLLQMSASLVGQKLVVNYTREQTGQIHDVWILTSEEAAEKRSTGITSSTSSTSSTNTSTTPSGPTQLR